MERLIFATVSLAILADLVSGHGHMTLPPSRNGGRLAMAADCMKGECMWFSQPDAGGSTYGSDSPIGKIKGEPTLNAPELRTYNVDVSSGPRDYTRHNPWRAPGSAPVIGSGCGRGGGGGVREGDGGTAKEFGLTQNMDGADLPPLANHSVSWTRGTVQEVAWANNANHGGGYAYRLCKKGSGAWRASVRSVSSETTWTLMGATCPSSNGPGTSRATTARLRELRFRASPPAAT